MTVEMVSPLYLRVVAHKHCQIVFLQPIYKITCLLTMDITNHDPFISNVNCCKDIQSEYNLNRCEERFEVKTEYNLSLQIHSYLLQDIGTFENSILHFLVTEISSKDI